MFRPFGSTTTPSAANPTTPFGSGTGTSGGFGVSAFGGTAGGGSGGGLFNPTVAPGPTNVPFGATTATTGFASAMPRYTPTTDTENNVSITLHTITAMPAYQGRSLEELRLEDYLAGRKGAMPAPFSTASSTTTSSALPMGGAGGTTGPFGFGASPNTGATAGGLAGTSTFGGSGSGGFFGSSGGGSIFGATPSAVAPTTSTAPFTTGGGGLFSGTAAQPSTSTAFGGGGGGNTGAGGLFGAKPATTGAFGGTTVFGATPVTATTTTSSGLFGSKPTSSFGGFGGGVASGSAPGAIGGSGGFPTFGTTAVGGPTTLSNAPFGSSQPTATTTAPTSLFGQPAAAAPGGFSFGTSATAGPISTTGSSFAPFGAATAPPNATAAPTTGGFSFGATTAPSTTTAPGGFSFGNLGGTSNLPGSSLVGGGTATSGTGGASGFPSFSFGMPSQQQPQSQLQQPSQQQQQQPASTTAAPSTLNFGTGLGGFNLSQSQPSFQLSTSTTAPTANTTMPTTASSSLAAPSFNFNLSAPLSSSLATAPATTNTTAATTSLQGLPLVSSEALSIKPPLPAILTSPATIAGTSSSAAIASTTTTDGKKNVRPHSTLTRTPPRPAFRLPSTATSTKGKDEGTIVTAMGYILPRKAASSIKKLVVTEPTISSTTLAAKKEESRLGSRIPSQESLLRTSLPASEAPTLDRSTLTQLAEGERYMIPNETILRRLSYAQLSAVSNFTVGQKGIGQVRFLIPVDLTKIDIRDIFERIVIFEPRQVTIYPDDEFGPSPDEEEGEEGEGEEEETMVASESGVDGKITLDRRISSSSRNTERAPLEAKPPIGQGLNVPAEIRLDRCWPLSKSDRQPIKDMSDTRLRAHIDRLKRVEASHFVDYLPDTGTWIFRVDHF